MLPCQQDLILVGPVRCSSHPPPRPLPPVLQTVQSPLTMSSSPTDPCRLFHVWTGVFCLRSTCLPDACCSSLSNCSSFYWFAKIIIFLSSLLPQIASCYFNHEVFFGKDVKWSWSKHHFLRNSLLAVSLGLIGTSYHTAVPSVELTSVDSPLPA